MTKEKAVLYINIMARLLKIVSNYSLPFQTLHALVDFEAVGNDVRKELDIINNKSELDLLLNMLIRKCKRLEETSNQKSTLIAYHTCIWMDQKITYERETEGKFSVYSLIPLKQYSVVEIGALNQNYVEVGIWINPKLPIFKSMTVLEDGNRIEKTVANRDAFIGMNGELRNITYFKHDKEYYVHNIIVPFEYSEGKEDGDLSIGFIPVSNHHDYITPTYKNGYNGKYKIKKMYIDHSNHQDIIKDRIKKGLEIACANTVDVVFAPEMLGTDSMEEKKFGYNDFVRQIYGNALLNAQKPPLVTIMPSYWHNGINQAAIIYRDGRILGYQRKYYPYIDFNSCSVEGIKRNRDKHIYMIHIYGVHRVVISICAEFLDGFDREFICGQLGATLVLVPSYSHGERDFVNSLPTLFPYGTSVVWGDCCGAVNHSPKIIGGCSMVGTNQISKMGEKCKCSFSCDSNNGCLFVVKLPLKIVSTKEKTASYDPIQHIVQ